MSLHHMILGCLMESPSYGYEIKKRVKDLFHRSHDVNEGQLYAVLRKMEAEGLVTKEMIYQEKNPPRKVFHPTDKGRNEFYLWLIEESDTGRDYRFDFYQAFPFLEKYNYFKHVDDQTAQELLKQQIVKEQAKLEEFKGVKENMQKLNLNHYRINIIEFGITFQENKLDWLKNVKNELPPI